MMIKLLIVDDSDPVCQRLAYAISALENVQVVGLAHDIASAKRMLAVYRPDAITIDLRLPDGSGLELLKFIKRCGYSPLVIMLTAFPYSQMKRRCLLAGANFFLDKATDYQKVVEILERTFRESDRVQMGG